MDLSNRRDVAEVVDGFDFRWRISQFPRKPLNERAGMTIRRRELLANQRGVFAR